MKKLLLIMSYLLTQPLSASYIQQSKIQWWENLCHNYTLGGAFSALALKPSSGRIYYAAEAIRLPLPSPHWHILELEPRHKFGFDLNFIATNNATGNSFMVNWEHFSSCTYAAASAGSANMIGPFFQIGPNAEAYSNARGSVHFNFNEVNINAAHAISLSDTIETNIFCGIGITSITQLLHKMYFNETATVSREMIIPACFHGAGPQLGMSFSYNIKDAFYLTGKGIFSLLSGALNNYTKYSTLSPFQADANALSPNPQSTSVMTRSQLIPAFEQKIGFAYECIFSRDYYVQLAFGYQAQIYISAIQSTDISHEVLTFMEIPPTVGFFADSFQRNISNFALSGFYITLAVQF